MANWLAGFLERNPEYNDLPVAARAARGIHFRLSGGEIAAFLLGTPIHYLDPAAGWLPIDTRLQLLAGDLDEAGEFLAVFRATLTGGGVATVPKEGYITVQVQENL